MAAPKGNKYAGSRKGIPNKRTVQWEIFTEYCLNGGLKRFEEELNKLEKEKFVDAFIKLLEFHKPKLARNTVDQTQTGKIEVRVVYDDPPDPATS